ncbi:MAG: flavodoxin, partial [Chloroflexota bacterium]
MSYKILIAYASKCGATGEVARAIGQVWADQGEHVDVKPVSEVASLDGYAAAAIGSAIRFGQWLPEAVEFVKKNQQALNQVPVAVFTVHIMNMGDDEQSLA